MPRWLKLLLTWMLVLALPLQALAAAALVHCGGHAGAGHHAAPGHVHEGAASALPDLPPAGVHEPLAAGGPAAHHGGHHAAAPAGDGASLTAVASASSGSPGWFSATSAASASLPHSTDPGAHPHQGLHGKCSACAACCGGVALPSAALVVGAVTPAVVYSVASPPAPAGHVPAGDERPPRSL